MAGQGRKPKADAIRRAGQAKMTQSYREPLPVPLEVASNPAMMECWDWIVGDSDRFSPAHLPQLISLTMWWAVARQCQANLMNPNETITTTVNTPMGPRRDPDIQTLAMATNQIRQLCSELGIGPLAEQRMGLMKVATMSMAADLPAKIFALMDGHDGD